MGCRCVHLNTAGELVLLLLAAVEVHHHPAGDGHGEEEDGEEGVDVPEAGHIGEEDGEKGKTCLSPESRVFWRVGVTRVPRLKEPWSARLNKCQSMVNAKLFLNCSLF